MQQAILELDSVRFSYPGGEEDRDGLRQLLEDRDKSFVLRELVQNAWDEPGVTHCDVALQAIPGKRAARLVVEDGVGPDDPPASSEGTVLEKVEVEASDG